MALNGIHDKNFNMKRTFKNKKAFTTRKEEVAAIRSKFPTKVPGLNRMGMLRTKSIPVAENVGDGVIVERFYKEISLPLLDKTKFLVPQEITMSQFVTIIRNRMQLNSHQAFYLLVGNRSMASLSRTLAEVYNEHKDEDGFLYVTYASQEVFGGESWRT